MLGGLFPHSMRSESPSGKAGSPMTGGLGSHGRRSGSHTVGRLGQGAD